MVLLDSLPTEEKRGGPGDDNLAVMAPLFHDLSDVTSYFPR